MKSNMRSSHKLNLMETKLFKPIFLLHFLIKFMKRLSMGLRHAPIMSSPSYLDTILIADQ